MRQAAILTLIASMICLLSPLASAANFKGRLEWEHKIEMRVLESGMVESVTVNLGQHIKKGQLLLRMDQRESKAKILQQKALIANAEVALEDAKREHERTLELFDRSLIAEEELKDAELKKTAAEAQLESARASLAAAQVAHDRTELKAPINGIVVAKNTWPGAVIYKTLQRDPLISIAANNRMLARVLLNARNIARYRMGQPAKVIVRGKNYQGKIHTLGVEPVRIDPEGAVYELDVLFSTNPRDTLRPAEVVIVQLP